MQEISAGEFWLDRNTSELFVFEPAGFQVARNDSQSDVWTEDSPMLEVTIPLSLPAGLHEPPPARAGPMLVLLDRVRNFRWEGIALARSRGMAMLVLNCSNTTLHGVNATGASVLGCCCACWLKSQRVLNCSPSMACGCFRVVRTSRACSRGCKRHPLTMACCRVRRWRRHSERWRS